MAPIGFWHYLARGSGIFFNVGKTFATMHHGTLTGDVWNELRCSSSFLWQQGIRNGGNFDVGFECLRYHGYDSVQFTHHMEHSSDLYEIVHLKDTHNQNNGNCFDPQWSWKYRQGWDASRPCNCRYAGGWGQGLHCDG